METLKTFTFILLSVVTVSCSNIEKEQDVCDNKIFKDFRPLYKDSIRYFDVIESENCISTYCFGGKYNQSSVFFTNIIFKDGEILKVDNMVFISPKYTDTTLNIANIELFDYGLSKGKTKTCSFAVKGEKYYYTIAMKDIGINEADSLYWFQMKDNQIINRCEVANFIVSKKRGISTVFESQYSDSIKVSAFNLIGKIPIPFANDITPMP
jgi:hypothetical protein